MNKIVIIGGGLAGTLLALYLAKYPFEIVIYERRADPRQIRESEGRSINLAISARGIAALNELGLSEKLLMDAIPMVGRMIHPLNADPYVQYYGRNENQYINSISRRNLNCQLLNELEQCANVTVHFAHNVIDIDFELLSLSIYDENNGLDKTITIADQEVVIAADGATSYIRKKLVQRKLIHFTENYLTHAYKELAIKLPQSKQLAKNYLHIWPRNDFMLIALPNFDDSFTGTLFLPEEGGLSFAKLYDAKYLMQFFEEYFPDTLTLFPNLVEEYFRYPIGSLVSVQGEPWYYQDKFLLIGDAAHAMVPFFGQGMNCAFEDCQILDSCIKKHMAEGWAKVFAAFFQERKKNTDAIITMSQENYQEMRANVIDAKFLLKKQVEKMLQDKYPDHYIPQYHLVSFSTVPYAYAKYCGDLQKQLLSKLCDAIDNVAQLDWLKVDLLMQDYLAQIKRFV